MKARGTDGGCSLQHGGIAQLVEHSVHTRQVVGSSPISATIRSFNSPGTIRPVGQEAKTPPFHGGNMGSIPVRVTKKSTHGHMSVCAFF